MKRILLEKLPEEPVSHNDRILKKVIIRNGEIPGITQFSKAVFPPGETAAGHTHDDLYEIFLTEGGSGTIEIDGNKIPLQQGTCITVEPGELHEVTNTEKEDLVLLILGIFKIK